MFWCLKLSRFGLLKAASVAGNSVHTVPSGKRWHVYTMIYTAAGIVAAPGVHGMIVEGAVTIAVSATSGATVAAVKYDCLAFPVALKAGSTISVSSGEAGGATEICYEEFDV